MPAAPRKGDYDLAVIGSGVAAMTVAAPCAEAGWSVAMIDQRPFGGTCVLRGCDPKKVLWTVIEAQERAARLRGHGLDGLPAVDWSDLQAFKRGFTDPVTDQRRQKLSDLGIDAFEGRARFLAPDRLDFGGQEVRAKNILIAAGSKPTPLPIKGAELLTTSDDFLSLAELPRRILFVGGGYISFEFAFMAVRAGAQVGILHQGQRPLENFDEHLVEWLVEHAKQHEIAIHLQTDVTQIARRGDGLVAFANLGEQPEPVEFEADLVVHGAGRVPDILDLDLEAGQVGLRNKFLDLDPHLRSRSNPRVWAAGDAASRGPLLTPVAHLDGEVVLANMLRGGSEEARYEGIPSVVFVQPPLAMVGLTEAQAREKGLKFRCKLEDTRGWYNSRRLRQSASAFKVLIEDGSERVLGAHILGPSPAEVINLFALAVQNELPASALRDFVPAYPTAGSDIGSMLP